jgi:hypothetical protein
MMAVPGVFFNYEISPMKITHTETRQSFAHFLTSYVPMGSGPVTFQIDLRLIDRTCAIIGGVLTIAGLVDSFIFNGAKRLKGEGGSSGFGAPGGKMVSP